MTQPTRADLLAAVAKLTRDNALLREQRTALYDILAAVPGTDADWAAGYIGSITYLDYLGEDGNAKLLREHAAAVRKGYTPRPAPSGMQEPKPVVRIIEPVAVA